LTSPIYENGSALKTHEGQVAAERDNLAFANSSNPVDNITIRYSIAVTRYAADAA
jgi:hypothetical protein